MQINATNAILVAAIFNAFTDARFTMRSLSAVRKAAVSPEAARDMTDAKIVNAASEIGIRLRRRGRDDAILLEKPRSVSNETAQEIANRALTLLGETPAEPFDVDFTAELEAEVAAEAAAAQARAAAAAQVAATAMAADPLGDDDEDALFGSPTQH